MPQGAGYKRKQYLVAKKFQLKYVGLILLLVFLTGALCSYVVYYTSMLVFGDKLANVYPQGRLMSVVNTVNLRMLLSLLLVTPLVVIIGIYASHKIAGPIFRIEKFLGNMADGDLTQQLILRKNDELVSLANGINRVVDSFKGTVGTQKEHLEKASVLLGNLKRAADTKLVNHAALEDLADKLSIELGKLNGELDKYKV